MLFGASFFHGSGGTFTHNNGTVTFDGGGSLESDLGAENFNNLNFNDPDGSTMTIFGGPAVALGALALNDGKLGGAVEAQAAVTVGPNLAGGTGTLGITGPAGRPITWDRGPPLINH